MIKVKTSQQKQNIMVIENDLDMRELLNNGLELDGYNIIVADDEDEAIKILGKITPDMIIINTVTSDAHSLHILDTVKNRTDVPMVIITPDNEIETLKQLYKHGADDIAYKPLNMRHFTALLRAILRRWNHIKDTKEFPKN